MVPAISKGDLPVVSIWVECTVTDWLSFQLPARRRSESTSLSWARIRFLANLDCVHGVSIMAQNMWFDKESEK
jgi:hypothetical protein